MSERVEHVAEDDVLRRLNGSLPVETTDEPERRPRQRGAPVESAGRVLVEGPTPRARPAGQPLAMAMDEAIRKQLTRLVHTLFLSSGGTHFVAFSGVESGVGCSWVLIHVAQLLAEAAAGSVCVVDANFRSPMLHTYLGAKNLCGLSDLIIDPDPARKHVQGLGDGLHLLSAGCSIKKAEPLLASSAFRSRIEGLRASFDYVLFDTPPLSESPDALAVASKLDGLAMVVAADSTNRDPALRAARAAAADNVRMLGVVLNKRSYPVPDGIYRRF